MGLEDYSSYLTSRYFFLLIVVVLVINFIDYDVVLTQIICEI